MIIADFKFVNPQGRELKLSVYESHGKFTFNRTGAAPAMFDNRQSALLEFFKFVGAVCASVEDTARMYGVA